MARERSHRGRKGRRNTHTRKVVRVTGLCRGEEAGGFRRISVEGGRRETERDR